MGRLDAIAPATRPRMHGRVMLSGPAGAGKTFSGLSVARTLADKDGSVLVIDTERESALTYADTFAFEHLPWRPPFDPSELAVALGELGDRFDVVMIDSLTHFWRGEGGTLDIADGKIGGWKAARPAQERLVQAILAVPAHILLCVRSKMDYLIEGGGGSKQTVTKLGLAPVQDDTLAYEVNVAFDIDSEHRISVTKSRCTAVPVGRMYPAGHEGKAAADYAEWLAGGVPPANRVDVDRIVGMFADVGDGDLRKNVKQAFVQRFGMPHSLTAQAAPAALEWLTEKLVAAPTTAASGEATSGPNQAPDDSGAPDAADGADTGAQEALL